MTNSFFQFKKFSIRHDLCAMKVGTDGVLLGAWANVAGCRSVLDVGTGTGLIALMIAQRKEAEAGDDFHIDAVDIDPSAATQARINADASPFTGKIEVYQQPFAAYAASCSRRYDLIVSNPPYFSHSLKCPDEKRNTARHDDTLPLGELMDGSRRLLGPAGRLALILPAASHEELKRQALAHRLHLMRETLVYPVYGSAPKRILAEMAAAATERIESGSLAIETPQHTYTQEYIALTKDFYLKM